MDGGLKGKFDITFLVGKQNIDQLGAVQVQVQWSSIVVESPKIVVFVLV